MSMTMRVAAPGTRASLLICALGWGALAAAPQARYSVSQEAAGGAGSPQVVVIRDNTAGIEAAVEEQ